MLVGILDEAILALLHELTLSNITRLARQDYHVKQEKSTIRNVQTVLGGYTSLPSYKRY